MTCFFPSPVRSGLLAGWLACATGFWAVAAPEPSATATVRIDAARRSPHQIPRFLTGKFTEHLFNNVYHGIEAQVLQNPTFAAYPFWTGQTSPDGVATFHWETDRIGEELRRRGRQVGWPDTAVPALREAFGDGLAAWWARLGPRESVHVSPDTARYGQRAQRVEVKADGEGVYQWCYLPLHRVRKFEVELYVRSPDLTTLALSLATGEGTEPSARTVVTGLSREWRAIQATLDVALSQPADAAYRFAITATGPGQFVLGHVFLRPRDHLNGADPDIVARLRESRLPIHRWPGGNFVSGYHWQEGVGPIEQRPTVPNYAWGNVEPNTFGTDEFIAFCRTIGCEPMICVNAGNGTAEAAARWVEYCNGSPATPMGRLRSAYGHSEAYGVKHWEIGNELWGRWQVHWTTGRGYADRLRAFAQAMRAVDPTIRLYACGAPVHWGKDWNDALLRGAADVFSTTTDHPLIGGDVSRDTEPLDVFRDFMAVPDLLEQKWAALRDQMIEAGVQTPRLAITELQMFAHLRGPTDSQLPTRLTSANLVNPATLGEALYDILYYHAAVRLAPFVELVTHSATVNHGGGLRKEHGRVYANPCHYAQAAFADFADAVPVAVAIEAPVEQAPRVLADVHRHFPEAAFKTVDVLAAIAADGDLLISIVHRATRGMTRLEINLAGFTAGSSAPVRSLYAEVPWAANTLTQPEAVRPVNSEVEVRNGHVTIDLPPYSVSCVRVPKAAGSP